MNTSQKITFLKKNLKIFKNFFLQKKNAILLVLIIEEISLWPELSSPPPVSEYRGVGLSVTEKSGRRRAENLVFNLGLLSCFCLKTTHSKIFSMIFPHKLLHSCIISCFHGVAWFAILLKIFPFDAPPLLWIRELGINC